MDLREVGYDDRDWINLAQDRDRWQLMCPAQLKRLDLMFLIMSVNIEKATGMAQSVKALACLSELALGREFHPRLG
ncbi:hypothetical protein ANN_10116 [Periplaneta americana]|uniref:Uncharacterized protein n=1 Tax=Periplaneta americana TaxID=6978 RepID=A0ABQ8TN65_PERAM|nr:hypothetical protein ANN_10116 [Periplaneta americana]